MKIYRATDKIEIKIDDVTIEISPLSYEHKTEVQDYMLDAAKGDVKAGMAGAKLAIKYAVKGINGVEYADGSKYELDMENNILTESGVEELVNSEMSTKLMVVCCSLLNGITSDFKDPNTGEQLKGVSLVKNSKRAQKKK